MSKTLVIYNIFSLGRNPDFFMRNGVNDSPDVDYIFVSNNKLIDYDSTWLGLWSRPNVEYYTRDNIGYDYGAYSYALFKSKRGYRKILEEYDFFIFINESVLGPLLPSWWERQKDQHWVSLFTSLIDDQVKLGGTHINYHKGLPHVQGHMFVTDKIGLDIGIKNRIFETSVRVRTKEDVINCKEVKFSTDILNSGYNIASQLSAFDGVDFRKPQPNYDEQDCTCSKGSYFGTSVQPFEVIFHKTNRTIDDRLVNLLVQWKDKEAPDLFSLS